MSALTDGAHDVVVIDARADEDGVVHFELAITSGAHKGDVVRVAARAFARDPLDVLGLPAVLHVHEGVPSLDF